MNDNNQDIQLNVTISEPELTPELDKQIAKFGYEVINLLTMISCIEQDLKKEDASNPHIAWQLIKGCITALATHDPNIVHFAIAREAFKDEDCKSRGKNIDRDSEEYKEIILLIARRLNEHCHRLKICLELPDALKQHFEHIKKHAEHEYNNAGFSVIKWGDVYQNVDSLFKSKSIFRADEQFLEHLKSLGKNGSQMANNIRPLLMEAQKKSDILEFWFNLNPSPEKPIFISQALIVLGKAIWRDEVSRRSNIITRGVPALTQPVNKPLMAMLSPWSIISRDKDGKKIELIHQSNLVGSIEIPSVTLVNATIINYVLKGIEELNSLTAHRAIRLYAQSAFNQYRNGIKDFRILRYDGGDSEIVMEHLGLKSRPEISRLKTINHALNHFVFAGPEITSRLINLGFYKSPITGRQEGIEITVLSPLLPGRTFEDKGLLIPLTKEPPFISRPNLWAQQLLLHGMILEQFVAQSIDLATIGGVRISDQKWQSLAHACKLSKDVLIKVKDRWTHDGDDGPRFLVRIENDFYTLGDAHKKELYFLQDQGELRIKQSNRGRASAEKRYNIKDS